MNGVEHRPENIALELERTDRGILQFARIAMFDCDFKRFVRIAAGLRDSAAEIIKAARVDPMVELFKRGESRGH